MTEIEEILMDIRMYIRSTAATTMRQTAKETIDSYEKALVYSNLTGNNTQVMIEKNTGVIQQTISNWINSFVVAGLVCPPNSYCKNYKALFTLMELGINPESLKKKLLKKPRGGGDE